MNHFLLFTFVINFFLFPQGAYAQQMSLRYLKSPIKSEDIIAKLPIKDIANQLKIPLATWLNILENPTLPRHSERTTAWLFHGDPGTGKTTLAQTIAEETNCHFILIKTASLVTSLQGSGAQALNEEIESAKKLIGTDNKKGVVICLDGIHSIVNKESAGTNNENAKAASTLYGEIINLPILIIGTTNDLYEISYECKSRFKLYKFS